MWLRRQDELNEARPTERFSTAIRLLSGRAAMERKYAAKALEEEQPESDEQPEPDATAEAVDVRALAVPATEVKPAVAQPQHQPKPPLPPKPRRPVINPRAKVLARRRRTTTMLFLSFTAGTIVAAVGGLAFLWAPAVPAALLTLYIGHLRHQERRRFEFTMDQRRAAEAAKRLRERARPQQPAAAAEPAPATAPEPVPSPLTADRRALVEQTDHAEWVDQQREQRAAAADDGWDPVPVPLPTYVTAPVAPRTTGGIDLNAADTWSSARSSSAAAEPEPEPRRDRPRTTPSRRPRDRSRTPLFDQYADEDRPRAANE